MELKNIYSYQMPEVVVKRSLEELNKTRPWYERLFNLNPYTQVDYDIIESRLLDFFVASTTGPTEMMDEEADIIWHTFLLDTINYDKFCKEYVGKFVHHKPYIEKSCITKDQVATITNRIVTKVNDYRKKHKLHLLDEGPYLDNSLFFVLMCSHINSTKGENL